MYALPPAVLSHDANKIMATRPYADAVAACGDPKTKPGQRLDHYHHLIERLLSVSRLGD